jgi:hypothetical protein
MTRAELTSKSDPGPAPLTMMLVIYDIGELMMRIHIKREEVN